jgi:hypothetical protein
MSARLEIQPVGEHHPAWRGLIEADLWQAGAASGFARAPFAVVAPLLSDYGYAPIPIKPGYKAPLLDDWQAGHPVAHWLPHHDPETGRVTNCASWGTGILTTTCPAIDLDIKDRELVRVLIELAGEMLGPTPFRIGARPKALLPFATSRPFGKITGRWWALPDEDFRVPGYAPHRIEILGRDNQFFAYAIHPGTGRTYRWRRYDPISTPRDGLPSIDEAEARNFLATAERVIQGVGAVPLVRRDKVWTIDRPKPATRRLPRPIVATSNGWQLLEPETLAKAIDQKHATRTKVGWITSCPAHTSEGHRSLSVLPRTGGGSFVHCFAECAFPEIARADRRHRREGRVMAVSREQAQEAKAQAQTNGAGIWADPIDVIGAPELVGVAGADARLPARDALSLRRGRGRTPERRPVPDCRPRPCGLFQLYERRLVDQAQASRNLDTATPPLVLRRQRRREPRHRYDPSGLLPNREASTGDAQGLDEAVCRIQEARGGRRNGQERKAACRADATHDLRHHG